MSSTHKLFVVALSACAIVGCARIDGPRTQQLSSAPIIEDEAMAHRQWDQTTALYAHGKSVSYPTLYPYVPRRDVPEVESYITAPFIFAGQTLFLPITALLTPAWEEQAYGGVDTPPTYTAVPVVQSDAAGYARITRWPIHQADR